MSKKDKGKEAKPAKSLKKSAAKWGEQFEAKGYASLTTEPPTREAISGSVTVTELDGNGYLANAMEKDFPTLQRDLAAIYEAMVTVGNRQTTTQDENIFKAAVAYELMLLHVAHCLGFIEAMRVNGVAKLLKAANAGRVTAVVADSEGHYYVNTENPPPVAMRVLPTPPPDSSPATLRARLAQMKAETQAEIARLQGNIQEDEDVTTA